MSGLAIANLAAEEPEAPDPAPEAARCAARLWGALLPMDTPGAGLLEGHTTRWPGALAPDGDEPAWRWLETDCAQAWLNTEAAAETARARGLRLAGAPPEVVRTVHDKAFAHAVCEDAGLVPRSLRGLVSPWSPEALCAPEAAREILARVAAWPAWTEGRFTLKPRFGSSGRGRLGGDLDGTPAATLAAGLPRLADRGGALLEPWVARERDYSVQLHVAIDGAVTLLGTLGLETSPSGVYRGHRARLDHRLRLSCGPPDEDALLEAALQVAAAAQRAGYHGPCGVDAFRFRGADGSELRACVELNARFTMGTVVAGLCRRLRPRARARLATQPGDTLSLRFALAAPPEGWPGTAPPQRLVVPLAQPGDSLEPALVIERTEPG